MKRLPCDNCSEGAELRDGTPYLIGRPPDAWPFRVSCARCKRVSYVTAAKFNQLPEVSPDQLMEWHLLEQYVRDLTLGGSLTTEQAIDLYRAGWTVPELAALPGTDL